MKMWLLFFFGILIFLSCASKNGKYEICNRIYKYGDKIIGLIGDEREIKIEDINSDIDRRLHGITVITKVNEVPYDNIKEYTADSGFKKRYIKDGFLYFDIVEDRDVRFSEVESAWLYIISRYKTKIKVSRP
jgi:hypothetical protein